MNGLNKMILKTAAWGLVGSFVVFSYGLGIFAFAFPSAMADFYDMLGDRRLSAVYHERVYNRSPSPENLYYALDKFIISENHEKILVYSEKFFELEEYDTMAAAIREYKLARIDQDLDAELKEIACNEDNRLRCSYIDTLLALDRAAEAETFFIEHQDVLLDVFVNYYKERFGIA